MRKKIVIKVMVVMVLFMSFLLSENGIFNIGNIEAYAETDEWEYWVVDENEIYIQGCYGKKTILDIPSEIDGYRVTGIDDFAFSGYSGLKSITIPQSVTYIGGNAFSNCSSLKSITVPQNVKYIGEYAFSGCSSLTNIDVDNKNKVYDSRNNCNAIIEKSSNTLIAGCKNTVIPQSVISIGATAFSDCRSLKSITIPQGVTSIGEYAFYDCRSLKSITIPQGVTSIGEYAFCGCRSLKIITIPQSVTSIGNSAFSECSSLKSIDVDKKNKVYDSRNNCNAIIEKSSNTLIAGCKNTVIPKSVTTIGWCAFSGSTGLKSITIPQGVTDIDLGAFSGCSSLKSITISQSVTSIGNEVFSGCKSLKSIEIPESVIEIGYDTFGDISESITIYSSINSYAHKYALDHDINWRDVNSKLLEPAKVKELKQKESYSTTEITLTWKKTAGADGYEVYRAASKNGKYKKVAAVTGTTYKNNKLKTGKTYYYKVCAYKSDVRGEYSSVIAAVTKTAKPTLKAEGGKKKAVLTWENVTGADGYEIYMRAGKNGKYKRVKTVEAKTTKYTKSKLAKGKKYYFKIRTYRTVGGKKVYSDWSAVESVKIK